MPRLRAATKSGSPTGGSGVAGVAGVVGVVVAPPVAAASFVALSNSFFASPIDRANSGSFCGPHMKITSMTPTTISHS